MKNLRDWLAWAKEKNVAIGHFNVSDSEGFKAVVAAANELGVPVIIGVSEGERSFLGVAEIRALVSVEQGKGLPVFLNADHTYSIPASMEAIDQKFDALIIDGANHCRRCGEVRRSDRRRPLCALRREYPWIDQDRRT
ncbi:class II fructose-bisphosphate aldolase [Candidatus Parcubacteria bacterium]|nr:class II fructose-bisphosphate aldolase [Candidatus Parcubacteria bacterium]